MSTIASPRSSNRVRSPSASSTRSSVSTDRAAPSGLQSSSTPHLPQQGARRNRAALRDYYNLSTSNLPSSTTATVAAASEEDDNDDDDEDQPSTALSAALLADLDAPRFSPGAWTARLLASAPLSRLLQTEGALVAAIRALDGERKALVYDNYSKLIAATDTIRRMVRAAGMDGGGEDEQAVVAEDEEVAARRKAAREDEDALAGRVAGVVEVAEEVASRERGVVRVEKTEEAGDVATVRWVVGAPARLRGLTEDGKGEEARQEWETVRALLEKWEGIQGVREVWKQCEQALGEG